ncbi:uncharacterized protein LOC113231576 isoform X2 [Hyposmocoma kahamanoa]|uniref:uncharacterized protein LOC113231576 isoform X2 n=1 Tax=Hyposmocoma kahamanoa TaxID=1477025 RepID=UPI000E6D8A51|nr:uncharacterized protein LOC113231576 isoform X2 [Hyposmocoma kahamanoa]
MNFVAYVTLTKKHKSKNTKNDGAPNTPPDLAVEESDTEWPHPVSVSNFTAPESFTNAAESGSDEGNEEVLYSLNAYYRLHQDDIMVNPTKYVITKLQRTKRNTSMMTFQK